jgi:hypothetical protein
MAFPFSLYNELRIYDRAVADFVNSLPVDYGEMSGMPERERGLFWVYATPSHAHASAMQVLKRKGWTLKGMTGVDDKGDQDWYNIPYPFASITRSDPVPDPSRGIVPFVFRKFQRYAGNYAATRHPLAYDIQYTIEYWMRSKFTEAHLLEWLAVVKSPIGASPNEFFLTVPFPEPWGEKIIAAKDMSLTDNSDLEPGDEDDRQLRFTLTFNLKAWFFHPIAYPDGVTPPDGQYGQIPGGDTTSTSGGSVASSLPEGSRPAPTILRSRVDIGLESLKGGDTPIEPTSINQYNYDLIEKIRLQVPKIIQPGPLAEELEDDTRFLIPDAAGGYIQVIDVPTPPDEVMVLQPSFQLPAALADDSTVEILDFNGAPLQRIVVGAGETEITPTIYTTTEDGVNAVRIRYTPPEETEVVVDGVVAKMGSMGLTNATNLLPDGSMPPGSDITQWHPLPGSTTKMPTLLAFSTDEHYVGTQSLKVEANGPTLSDLEGVEHELTVQERRVFLVSLRLKGAGGVIEFSVLDDVPSGTPQHIQTVHFEPTDYWARYSLITRPIGDKIALRVRQRTSVGTTFYLDGVTVREVAEGLARTLSS